MISAFGLGAGAGLASALLFAVVTTGNPLSLVLYAAAPLPILLVGLGWRHVVGLVASVVGSLAVTLGFGPPAGLAYAAGVALPAWWLAYLALLARPAGNGAAPEWYPLGRLLLWIAGLSAGLTFAGAALLGTGDAVMIRAFERALDRVDPRVLDSLLGLFGTRTKAELAAVLAWLAPPSSAAAGVLTSTLLLWIAGRVVKASHRLPRPWPTIAEAAMPASAIVLFGVAVVGSALLDGLPGIGARALAGALTMAYALQGLATLHLVTRRSRARGAVLAATYVAILAFSGWPMLLLAGLGLADGLFGLRARRLPPPSTTS